MWPDLPAGKWTAALIGPWWPAPATNLRGAAQHWNEASALQQQYAQDLRNKWTGLAARNQGNTAEDLIARYQHGEKFHLDLAEKYQTKAAAFNSGADAIDYLRSRLAAIASTGNKEIDDVLGSKRPLPEKLAEVQAIQARCNADAANASLMAVDKITGATQKVLDADGVGGDARTWASDRGLNVDKVPLPRAISKDELNSGLGAGGRDGNDHASVIGPAATGTAPNAFVSGGRDGIGAGKGGAMTTSPAAFSPGGRHMGGPVPPAPPPAPSAVGGVQMPGGGSISPGMPGVPGGSVSPAGIGGQGLSPGLGQSFTNGMITGQPAGVGAQSLSSGAINAMESGTAPPPHAGPSLETPSVAPTIPSAGAFNTANAPLDAPPPVSGATAPPTSGGTAPVAPAIMTGGSWSAAPTGGTPAAPAGPLPAYGSDLRPPIAASPAIPSAPPSVSGAAVASSPGSTSTAGGPLVSPVERAAAGTAARPAGATSSATASSSELSATTGAAAGAVSGRAAEQQRLQRLVDAVARQEPRLSWAAGLRDDGTTSQLVTDLASGWIPPHVRLPAHVTLLEPTARRRDVSVVDLLGAVTVAAAHHPNSYVAEAGPDAPALSGDRLARSAVPNVDDFGPTLVEAVRRRDGLPRIAQAVAAPAVRKTGVLENEAELLRRCIVEIQHSVLNAYPDHAPAAVADWMLLAAIQALIDEHEYLANYHMAWFAVISGRGGS